MRKHRSPDQVRKLLGMVAQDVANGLTVHLACRKVGIHPATYFRWKQRLGEASALDAASVPELEAEIKRLKLLVANLVLEKQMLQEVVQKKW